MNFKKAVVGTSMVTIVATILIILILLVYAVIGVLVKGVSGSANEYPEILDKMKQIGDGYENYFFHFSKLLDVRGRVFVEGVEVGVALKDSDYGVKIYEK